MHSSLQAHYLGYLLLRFKPGYNQQERFHKYVEKALETHRNRYRAALSDLKTAMPRTSIAVTMTMFRWLKTVVWL